MRVKIEKVINNAYGLSHDENGKALLIPYTVQGDIVEVQKNIEKKNLIFCNLLKVITPSPYRVSPICEHYTVCGGCDMLHINREEELKIKQSLICEDFPFSKPIIFGKAEGYRSRFRFSQENESVGFKKRFSNEVVNIQKCPLISENISNIVNGKKFYYDDTVFFQNNHECAGYLAEYVLKSVKKVLSNIQKDNYKILDLYAGVGFFSSFLEEVENFSVYAVEGNVNCEKFAKKNCLKTHFYTQKAENVLKLFKFKFDCVVVDPARSGLNDVVINSIISLTNNIVYVSCNEKALVRDVKKIIEKGFSVIEVQPFDMFPRIHHTETVALLSRGKVKAKKGTASCDEIKDKVGIKERKKYNIGSGKGNMLVCPPEKETC